MRGFECTRCGGSGQQDTFVPCNECEGSGRRADQEANLPRLIEEALESGVEPAQPLTISLRGMVRESQCACGGRGYRSTGQDRYVTCVECSAGPRSRSPFDWHCETCDGTGTWDSPMEGPRGCPECGGTGELPWRENEGPAGVAALEVEVVACEPDRRPYRYLRRVPAGELTGRTAAAAHAHVEEACGEDPLALACRYNEDDLDAILRDSEQLVEDAVEQ